MITTTDNNCGKCIVDSQQDLENLLQIANRNISGLKNVLVFPPDFKHYGDEIQKQRVFDIDLSAKTLTTGNIMGFIGCGGTQVSIRSRFAQSGNEDYFMHYMLQKVFSINVFNLKHSKSDEPVFDFLMYMFPFFLKKARQQGLFKKYIRNQYNDSNLRGPIDVSRHIRFNEPFNGKVAYNTREYSFDNPLTQLVRHTIEYIKTRRNSGNILYSDEDIRNAVSDVRMSTPTYNRKSRNSVIYANLKPVNHPFFTHWRSLQNICLQILRHESLKYGIDNHEIYGILFDVAWLWEEYLNIVLKGCGFTHPRNKKNENPIYLFEGDGHAVYPDFYKDDFILDAKYKHLENGLGSHDLHQIISYMHVRNAKKGAFAFPYSETKKTKLGVLNGLGGEVFTYSLLIPEADSYADFVEKISDEEGLFTSLIHPTPEGSSVASKNP